MKTLLSNTKKGMTAVEIIVSVSIFIMIFLIISNFNRDIFFLNSNLQSNMNAQFYARKVIRTMVMQLRSASPSSLGSYPIAQAGTSSLIFYSNIDGDAYKERIRYFLQGTDFKIGIIKPSGSPLTYNPAQETVTTLIRDVAPTTTPIFDYYAETYAGTSTALTLPIDILSIRLIRATLTIDQDVKRLPSAVTATSQVMLRNLKGNQ